jgi:hypothetical protein
VYFQGLFSVLLLCFSDADDLINASFRNAVLTLYAIGLALPITPDQHTSIEVKVVLQGFINILFISALALMSLRPVMRTWRHIAAFIGTTPLVYWSYCSTVGRIKNPQCDEFVGPPTVWMGSVAYPVYVILWGVSVAIGALVLPTASLLWVSKVFRRIGRVLIILAILLWIVAWIMTIVASETTLIAYKTRNRLDFGQIMTLVMLFSQVWDAGYYPFQQSKHGGTRIMHWWRTIVKPRSLQVWQILKKCKITSTSYCNSNARLQKGPFSEVFESWVHMLVC